MMGSQPPSDEPLFSYNVCLEHRVRKDHPLRRIKEVVDFDFIYNEVRDTYGTSGNVSVPPPVILKLMLLLVLYNVRSERELMGTLPERLDWLWFLGYTIETKIPDHSVLSKARRRWGDQAFKAFFTSIVSRCVAAGLVDGKKIFVDASFIDADASRDSMTVALDVAKTCEELDRRLEEHPDAKVNRAHVSTTDPDASLVSNGRYTELRYKTHRAVDASHEVVTTVEVTPGVVNEAHRLTALLDGHGQNTGVNAETVVADSKYATHANFIACHARKVRAHMRALTATQRVLPSRNAIFPEEAFTYDKATDTVLCPEGKRMERSTVCKDRVLYRMKAKICRACSQRTACTTNRTGRTLGRHIHQDILEAMHARAATEKAKQDLVTRQHLMERSFARGAYFGMKRARWRRLWRVMIQEYLICALQNIHILINHTMKRHTGIHVVHPAAGPLRSVQRHTHCSLPVLHEACCAILTFIQLLHHNCTCIWVSA